MLCIVVLSFCVVSTIAEPFYGEYRLGLVTPTSLSHYDAAPLLGPGPRIAPAPLPLETKTQYHYQDGFGSGAHGHSEPTSYHHATHDPYGNKQGEFSYLKPDGTIHKTRYIADSQGYKVLSNDLPVGPSLHTLRKRSIGYQYGSAPIVTPSGYLADTPEVSAAKAAHFSEHARRGNHHIAAAIAPAVSHYSAWPTSSPVTSWSTPVGSWSSLARSGHPIVTSNGYLQETPEVAHATAAHLAEKGLLNKLWDDNSYVSPYHGAYAIAPEGPVTDTPEVVAARNAHLAEHSAVLARTAGTVGGHVQPYYTPAAYLQPSGVPTDTPEVMHAKAAHFAEYARIASRQKRSIPVGSYPASTLPLQPSVLPVIPPPAVVLPHSTLALPYSLPGGHVSNVIHAPFASSYQLVA